MKTVVIIGSTLDVAHERLKKVAAGNGIVNKKDFYEATLDGHRIMAIGGGPDDVCWLRAAGFGVEIITVGVVSEEMQKRIQHVRTTNGRE